MCECGCESKGCYENYFVIYKGDDTDFIEGQSLVVEISTDIDLDGSTATFSFLGFSQTFDPIPSDKKLNIIIPHSETAKFPVGMVEATVTITNSSSKIRTVSNTIPIKVTQSVDEAYSPDNPNAISVTLSNGETGRLNAALDDIELLKKNKADKTDLEGFATEADLLAFYYPDGNVTSMSQITTSGIEYAVGSDGGAYVVKGNGLTGHVVLPWKVTIGGKNYKVTAIGNEAFESQGSVYNPIIVFTAPITVKNIGDAAFRFCGFISSINLPSVTSTGVESFLYCSSLVSVNLPSATVIGEASFVECRKLTTLHLHSATSIGASAFYMCTSLTTIDFGSSPKSAVPSLSGSAFEGVPTSCKFIIPLGMYDEWISASGWSDLYAQGYKFEGYASTAQIANKADKATTLAGYGITDAATKTELNAKADKSALAAKADKATTLAGYGITDAATMASITPEYSTSSAYSVGAFVYHDGNIYQCTTAIADGGEAWNAAHWELRKLDDFFTESNSLLTGTIDAEVISKGTAPDAHLEAPTDERLKLVLADNSVAYDSAKALPYKLTSAIGDRVIATMTLTAASTDIALPTISENDTTVKDFILDVTNAYAVEGVATDAGINIPRTDFKLVTRDGESLTDVTTVKAGKSAFICFTQKSPVVVDGTTYPCWCVIQLPFGDPS